MLRPIDELDNSTEQDVGREVSFLRSMRHPHIITFFGAGVDSENRAYLVTELMHSELTLHLRNSSQTLHWALRIQFAADVASGMEYLHSIDVIHRDLKADNCFVDSTLRVKVRVQSWIGSNLLRGTC